MESALAPAAVWSWPCEPYFARSGPTPSSSFLPAVPLCFPDMEERRRCEYLAFREPGEYRGYATGIKAGFEVQGRGDINVLGFAGDGATVDIGLQSLSGALERRDRILYVCYDNEGYMNTGIQGSGLRPISPGPRQRLKARRLPGKTYSGLWPLIALPMPLPPRLVI